MGVGIVLLLIANGLNVPDSLLLEMDSIICKWIRRKAINATEGNGVRNALRQYPIQQHQLTVCLDSAFVIAHQTGQSIYDGLYIALAVLLKGRMVTADGKLYDGLNKTTSVR